MNVILKKKISHEPFISTFLPLAHFSKSSIGLIFDFYSLPTSHLSFQLEFRRIFLVMLSRKFFHRSPSISTATSLFQPAISQAIWATPQGLLFIFLSTRTVHPQDSCHRNTSTTYGIHQVITLYFPKPFKGSHVNKKKKLKCLFQVLQGFIH